MVGTLTEGFFHVGCVLLDAISRLLGLVSMYCWVPCLGAMLICLRAIAGWVPCVGAIGLRCHG